jgi:hypothetical protein
MDVPIFNSLLWREWGIGRFGKPWLRLAALMRQSVIFLEFLDVLTSKAWRVNMRPMS